MERPDTTSYWIDSASLPRFLALTEDVQVDVIVVGGGLTGITTAYLMKKAGFTVALLERGRLAQVDTGHTTAHLTAVLDLGISDLLKKLGRDHARAVWDAGTAAIDQIARLVAEEAIDCDFKWVPSFVNGPFFEPANTDDDVLRADAKAAGELGIDAAYEASIPWLERPGLRFANQALFHPLRYLAALAKAIPGEGSYVFENSAVDETQDQPLAVKSGGHRVRGSYLVTATHTPLTGNASTMGAMLFQSKLAYYTTYAMGAKLPPGTVAESSYWDTSDPYYYLRVDRHRGFDYAILGGEDHKTGQAPDTLAIYRRLAGRLKHLLPGAVIDHQWSGQVIETNDGLPYIGEMTAHQFAGTGFSGNGMTFGTLTAMMAVDWVKQRKNPWQELFSPARKPLAETWDYLKENKDYPFYMVRDWLGGVEGKTLRGLQPGQGKILNLDGKKVAAYRDKDGEVSLCSPVCTHMQCIVGWNDAEQTWDCPCHGSRFKPSGEVISGPAEEPLEKIEARDEK